MNVLRTRRKVISAPSPEVEAHDALISFNSLMISSETSATFRDHGAADRRPRGCPTLILQLVDRDLWRHRGGLRNTSSHVLVIRSAAAFRHHPVDVAVGVLDV